MKNTIEYTRTIRGREYTFTAYRTKAAARSTVHESRNPCLVAIDEAGETYYDAYPLGHPLPEDAEIIERCRLRASGLRWIPVSQHKAGCG